MPLLCQDRPYLRTFDSEVLSCVAVEGGFEVRLRDALFYPEGGGQPADRGWIGDVPVEDVQNDGGVTHFTPSRVPLGGAVLTLDWQRRFDHMQQHSGQHLLTALVLRRFGWKTIGFHLGPRSTTIDLDTPAISQEERLEIEAMVNDAVLSAIPFQAHWVSPSEFDSMDVRTRGIPNSVTGPVRLIEIEGVDLNTCGGTHLSNSHQLQLFKTLAVERMRGQSRLHFLYGRRLLAYLDGLHSRSLELNRVFDQGAEFHLDIARKWSADLRSQKRTIKKLSVELARMLGRELAAQVEPVVKLHRSERDLSFLSLALSEACRLRPEGRYVLGGGDREGVFLLHAPGLPLGKLRGEILECIGGKGGGKPPRMQGKCSRLDRLDALCRLLREAS